MFWPTARWLVPGLLFSLVAGCSLFSGDSASSTAESPPPPQQQPAPALTSSAPAGPTADDSSAASALAQKVATYRHDVEPQLDAQSARSAAAQASGGKAPATQPAIPAVGDASWFAPDSLRLTTFQQDASAAPIHPAPAPGAASAPPADARTQSIADGNVSFPVSIPEGADRANSAQAVPASSTESPAESQIRADQLEHQLAAQLHDDPQDLAGQLDYELLLFIEGQPVPQMSALAGLRAEDRELLAAIMDGLSNFRSVVRADSNQLLATKTQPLIDMADRLRSQSELTLPTIALCTAVTSFGVYTPVEKSRFNAGADNRVVVYCEVRNFQSRLSADNQWQTDLTQQMVLYTETGLPVWPAKTTPQRVTDLCRQKRHDFCFAKLITLPPNLSLGRYVLKITVTDMQANHVAEASTPLEVVAE